jgi:hypothetical protein
VRIQRGAHGGAHLRRGVAERDGAVLGIRVQVPAAVRVGEPDALPLHKRVLEVAQPDQPAQLGIVEGTLRFEHPAAHRCKSNASRSLTRSRGDSPFRIGEFSTPGAKS